MMTKKEKKRVPELRFAGFEGEWEEKKLGKLTSKVGSGSTPRGGVDVYTTTGIPFIRSQNVLDNQLLLDETHIPESVHERMAGSTVLPNDVLLNITGGSIGRSCVVPSNGFSEGNVNQHVSIIRLKKDSPHFLQALLSSHRGQNLIYQGMTGSGREGLNFQSIRGFKINIPKPEEQQKIASFLTTIDTRIQQLEKKKTLLEQYKKGVMQKIFSQEIRFKPALSGVEVDDDGKEFGEWEERRLGDVANVYQPRTISQTDLTPQGYDVYGANGIIGKYSEYNHELEQVAVTCRGNTCGTVNFTNSKSWITGNAMVINVDESSYINKRYLYYLLVNTNLGYLITGSGQPQITGDIKKHKIILPDLEEQTKIAHFLSSLDRKITVMDGQIEKTKEWKKGLLQRMFV